MLPSDAPKPDKPADRLARVARASWLAPVIVVSINCFANTATQRVPALGIAVSVLQMLLLAGGIVAGIYAMLGARKVANANHVIAPAMIGTVLCVGLLGLNILFRTGMITLPAPPPATAPTTAPTSGPASAPTLP